MNTIILDEIPDKHDAQAISEMIWEILQDKGINAEAFSYTITVNYEEKIQGMSQPPAERKYKYEDHRDISPDMVDYLLSVADVSNIYSLDIGEINDYLNHLEQYQDEQYVQYQQSNRSM